jgi:hypothetical protein
MEAKANNKEMLFLGYTLVIAIIYFIFSTFSNGFYQHDEAAHFLNMQNFWVDPSSILSTWAKPGFKIAYVIPALLGAKAVLITNILFTAFMAYFTGKVIEEFKIPYRLLGMTIAAFAPMLYQISFRNYSEIITSFVLALIMFTYVRKKYFWTALLASYIFTLRQEMVLVSACLGLIFLLQKNWKAIGGLFIAPVLLNIFGWMSTGNPMFLIDQMTGGGLDQYKEMGFFHLWKMFTPSVGVISTVLFLIGVFGFLEKGKTKDYFKKYHIVYIAFVPVFLFMCFITEPFFGIFKLSANLRQLTLFAPAIGIFGAMGYNLLVTKRNMMVNWIIIGIFGVLIFSMLNYEYNHVFFTDVKDYSKSYVFLLGIGGALALLYMMKMDPKKISLVLMVLIIGHTIQQEEPYELSNEEKSVKKAVRFFKRNKLENRTTIFNAHNMFHYFIGNTATERKEQYVYGRYTDEDMAKLPVGAIYIWDSHYSYRQRTKGNKGIPLDFFKGNANYKPLFQDLSKDKRFYIAIFEKLK